MLTLEDANEEPIGDNRKPWLGRILDVRSRGEIAMTKNTKIGIIVGALLLGICGICGWAGIKYAVKALREDDMVDTPFYTLIADGDRLYVTYSASKATFDAVKGNPSKVKVTVDFDRTDWNLRIQDCTKVIERKCPILNAIWSEKNQSLYFLTNEYGAHAKGVPPRSEIWSWTSKGGFVSIFKAECLIFLSLSVDGKVLGAIDQSGDTEDGETYVTVSIRDKKVSHAKYEAISGVPVLIDQNTVVVSGGPPKIIDLKFGAIKISELDGYCQDFTWFHDQPWAMRYLNGKYEVVRFDETLSKVEQTVPILESFPKVNPPGEGS